MIVEALVRRPKKQQKKSFLDAATFDDTSLSSAVSFCIKYSVFCLKKRRKDKIQKQGEKHLVCALIAEEFNVDKVSVNF